MKKQLLNLSLIAAALAIYVSAMAAPIAPVATMDVPHHPEASAPALDGVADDYYSAAIATSYGYESQLPNWDGDSDFKCDYQVCWNTDGFYILAIIQDDVEHNYTWDYEQEWMFDNFEIFFQLDTNTVTTSYGPNTVQLRVNRGLDSVQSSGRAARSDWGYYYEANTGAGWLAEVAIPWSAVYSEGDTPEDIMDYIGVAVGFDLAGADSDNTDGDETVGNRDFQTFWDLDGEERTGQEDGAWNNTSVFGYIQLQDPGVSVETNTSSMNVYPNPATDELTIELDGLQTVQIFNITGVMVKEVETTGVVNVADLSKGIYMVKVANQTTKVIVE